MKSLRLAVVAVGLLTFLPPGNAGMRGPWFRYPCADLGFQMMVASGWKVTRIEDGVVFAMQYQPEPYVRVAVGRLGLGQTPLESVIQSYAQAANPAGLRRTVCKVDGLEAVKLEGTNKDGPFMDLFVKKADQYYWIGFAADRGDLWSKYSQTFEIVVEGFHFL